MEILIIFVEDHSRMTKKNKKSLLQKAGQTAIISQVVGLSKIGPTAGGLFSKAQALGWLTKGGILASAQSLAMGGTGGPLGMAILGAYRLY